MYRLLVFLLTKISSQVCPKRLSPILYQGFSCCQSHNSGEKLGRSWGGGGEGFFLLLISSFPLYSISLPIELEGKIDRNSELSLPCCVCCLFAFAACSPLVCCRISSQFTKTRGGVLYTHDKVQLV